MPEYCAHVDASITFVNGGALSAEGCCLDLPFAEVTDQDVGRRIVRHLGLALVGRVELRALSLVEKPHRASRGIDTHINEADPTRSYQFIDVSRTIAAGLNTHRGHPNPVITRHVTREPSVARYVPGTTFAMDSITMIGNTGTYLDSPYHRFANGTDRAGLSLDMLVELPGLGPAFRHARLRARCALPHRGRRSHTSARRGHPRRRAPAGPSRRPAERGVLHRRPSKIEDFGTFPVRAFARIPVVSA